MPIKPPESGIRSPYHLRLGIDIPRWRGLNKEKDPGAIGDDEFQEAVNIRILPNGAIRPRGGQSKVNTSAMAGCVEGIFDDEIGVETAKLYGGVDGSGTLHVFGYNPYVSPTVQAAGDGTLGSVIGARAARAYCEREVGSDRVIQSIDAGGDQQTEFTIAMATVQPFRLSSGVESGDSLYLVTANAAGTEARLYKWDGASLTLDDSVGPTHAHGGGRSRVVARDGEVFYVANNTSGSGNSVVRKRSTAGAWSDHVTFPVTSFAVVNLVDFNGTLYASSGDTPAPLYALTPGGGIAVESTITDGFLLNFVVFDGFLYYLWYDTVAERLVLGRFDGATWTHSYKLDPMTAPVGGYQESFIASFDSNLYGLSRSPAGLARIYRTDGTDATTWSLVETAAYSLVGAQVAVVA